MKNSSVTLGFIVFSTLLAAQDQTYEDSSPCVAYPPQYHMLQCDWGIFLTFDFLYWYAREHDLVWAAEAIVKDFGGMKGVASPKRSYHLDAEWSPGIRIGIGYNMPCDGWDLYINWMYLHNASDDSADFSWDGNPIPDIGQSAIFNPWVYGSWFTHSFWQNGKTRWSLNFDQMDLELGRKFWLSPCFTLRPYGGLRGTWLYTIFRVLTESTFPGFTQINPDLLRRSQFIPFFQSNFNKFWNTFWGVGLLGGLQPNWAICSNFILYGNFSGSLVWGRFFESNTTFATLQGVIISNENEQTPREVHLRNDANAGFHRMQGMLDLAIGLRWEERWCCNRFSTALDIGWENHYWMNYGLRYQNTGSFEDETLRLLNISDNANSYYLTENALTSDLTLAGLVIRLRVDF